MAKSIWRRNDLIYFDNRNNNGLSSGHMPGPTPTAPATVWTLRTNGAFYGSNEFGYTFLSDNKDSYDRAIDNSPLYHTTSASQKHDIILCRSIAASVFANTLSSIYWFDGNFMSPNGFELIYIPSGTGTDVYHVYVNSTASPLLNITQGSISGTTPNGQSMSWTIKQIATASSSNSVGVTDIVAALSNVQSFANYGIVMLIQKGYVSSTTIPTDDLLVMINSLLNVNRYTNVITVQ